MSVQIDSHTFYKILNAHELQHHWTPHVHLKLDLYCRLSAELLTYTYHITVAGHAADKLISQYRWPILKVRRLMTGIGLLGPGCLMLWLANITNLKLAVL